MHFSKPSSLLIRVSGVEYLTATISAVSGGSESVLVQSNWQMTM